MNLLHRLQTEPGLTYFFISHDLGVIRYIGDEVAVIPQGKVVEQGSTADIFDSPKNEYTRMLLGAMPIPITTRNARRSATPGPWRRLTRRPDVGPRYD